ncbi:MAG: dTDP-4-dehydrorhamnose 3,5-epimerase [Hyphomicrobium sp.]|jgi:dTDP-4-dehydrorhamnose 3,5-epimerase
MDITPLEIPEVLLITPKRFRDDRGVFCETFSQRALEAAGVCLPFVQDNHSISLKRGTIRGLHYQSPPHAQGKLVRATKGAVFDVAVDIRHGSPSFGKHVSALLSAENWCQLWVPPGFAHAFCTIEDDTEVLYKVTDYYAPQQDRGMAWDDVALGIPWPLDGIEPSLSDKDRRHPRLQDHPVEFTFERAL